MLSYTMDYTDPAKDVSDGNYQNSDDSPSEVAFNLDHAKGASQATIISDIYAYLSAQGCTDYESASKFDSLFDFTGTALNTKAKCQAIGFAFSDDDTPFPDPIYAAVDGTWTHDAGVGWKAASAVDTKGPVILLPLMRSHDWEAAITFNFAVAADADKGRLVLGTLTGNADFIALGFSEDTNADEPELVCQLMTNNGDDSLAARHTGQALAGAGDRELKIRNKNGCVSVYDEQDDTWYDFTGRQGAGVDYTSVYIFIQVQKFTGAALADFTIKTLTMTYS